MDIINMKISKIATVKTITADHHVKADNTGLKKANTAKEVHVGDAQTIAEANANLDKMTEIDMNKVKQVKQAISNGELNINLDLLSKAIMNEHLLSNTDND